MRNEHSKVAGFVGAAAVPHAPQMLSVPKSEDALQVARVRDAMQKIGDAFRTNQADLVIVIGNDHGDGFLRSIPAFTIHCGPRAAGKDGHSGFWTIDGKTGYEVLEGLQEEGFDPAFTLDAPVGVYLTIPIEFTGYSRSTPVLPIFVNSYLPPQPSPERCFLFGQALARVVRRMNRRAVLIAGGGMSHYPGTARYAEPGPDLTTDQRLFSYISSGNLRQLLSFDKFALDETGNNELLSWMILAGAIGERKPDVSLIEPNWHHTYGVFGWTNLRPPSESKRWYTAIPTEHVELARAIHALRTNDAAALAWIQDASTWVSQFALSEPQREALISLDEKRIRDDFQINAMLTAGALRRVNQHRKRQP
jgi:2,3-dihydroxyphenylpropionate 1,2-dioxygenase